MSDQHVDLTVPARLPLAAKAWVCGLAMLSAVGFWLPFVHLGGEDWSAARAFGDAFASAVNGRWRSGDTLAIGYLSFNFAAAFPLLYLAARVSLATLNPLEWTLGLALSVPCAMVTLFLGASIGRALAASGGSLQGLVAVSSMVLSLSALTLGAILAFHLCRSHKHGVSLVAFFMACYLASACWTLWVAIIGMLDGSAKLQPAAVICVIVCIGYAVELALLARNHRRWRKTGLSITPTRSDHPARWA